MREFSIKQREWVGAALGCLLVAGMAAGKTPVPGPTTTAVTPGSGAPETRLVVLGYHQFGEKTDPGNATYRVRPEEFRWQLQWIKDHGWTPVSIDQVIGFYDQGRPLPEKSVLITFDDGFKSVYTKGFPILREFGYPGTFFVYTDFLRGKGALALQPEDLDAMAAGGVAVESHSQTHPNMSQWRDFDPPAKYAAEVRREVEGSRAFLRERFKAPVEAFAYPYGVFNDEITAAAKAAGYRVAFTVNPGPNDGTIRPLEIRRELVLMGTKRERFASFFAPRVLHLEGLSPRDGEVIQERTPLLQARILDGVDPASVRVRMGDQAVTGVAVDPKTLTVRHQVRVPLARGGHMLTLTATDKTGQLRTFSSYFRVKKLPVKKTAPARAPQATSP